MGRSGGSGRGNGGRGGNRSNNSYKGKKKYHKDKPATKTMKSLSDHVYYIGSAKQASDYVTVTNYLINCIRQQYDHGEDIANALDN